tara:strand:- start:87454 stop:88395 length:942 start_codon:yes stop_codon:yes gene_type:complete
MLLKTKVKAVIRTVTYGIIAILIGWLFFKHKIEIQQSFQNIRMFEILAITLIQIPIIGLGGMAFYFLSFRAIKISKVDSIGLSYIANLLNQILPYRPGMIYRYFFLKYKYQMPLSLFFCIMSLYLIFTLITGSLFTVIGWWWANLSIINLNDFFILSSIVLSIIVLSLLVRIPKNFNFEEKFPTLHERLNYIKQNLLHPELLSISFLIFIGIHLLISTSLFYIYQSLNHTIPFTHCIFLAGMMSLSSILYVTPGNIGINESLFAAITQVIYQDFSIGLSASLLFRITQWIPGICLGCIFGLFLRKETTHISTP